MTMFQNLARTMKVTDTLKLQCEACGRRTTLPHRVARQLCGPDATPQDIRRRSKCRGCGVEGCARVWI